MADVLKDALEMYESAIGVQGEQRRQIRDDEQFSDPSDPQQWEEDVRHQRENDPGGRRPCLVVDQLGQYVANVAGQIEKQPPALHSIPVGGGADKKVAEQIDGRFRHIEYASRAQQHYQRVMTSAARLGVGYLIVRPEFTNRALRYQEPRISSEPDPLKVVLDPWSDETDGSTARFGFLLSPMSRPEFKRRWPKKDAIGFGDDHEGGGRDERDSVIVAEQWVVVEKTTNVIVAQTDQGEQSMTEAEFWAARDAGKVLVYVRNYSDKSSEVKWRRLSGAEVLEDSIYPADNIGIVPVYGYLGWRDGRMMYCGIPRRARVPQQSYNYHASEELAYIGVAPRSPWLIAHAALAGKGVKEIWDRASVEQRAYLPWQHSDENGPIPQPQRTNVATSMVNHQNGMQRAREDIQAAIGMYQASLGAPSNETSGIAIESRKQQGEASTAHFPSHMAASLTHLGKIVLQMDARLADTRRKSALIGVDGSAGTVVIDPEQEDAFAEDDEGEISINPRKGDYGVRVVIGASYSTQRSQTNEAFAEIMRGNPQMAPIVAPFWARTLDFAGSDKLAQALAAMAPAPVKDILQPAGSDKEGPSVAELSAKLEQLTQALQEATAIAQEAEQAETDALQDAAKMKLEIADKRASIQIDEYKAETERLKITGANEDQIKFIVGDLINAMLQSPSPLPGDMDGGVQGGPQPEPQPIAEPTAQPAPLEQPEPIEQGLPQPQGTL